MKTTIATIIIATMSIYTIAAEISSDFLYRLAKVESNCDDMAVNESSGATGRYQITQPYLDDANKFLGTSYSLSDCFDYQVAEKVVRAYLLHYGKAYEDRTGETATAVVLARIHNGGPRGAEKPATADFGTAFLDLVGVGE